MKEQHIVRRKKALYVLGLIVILATPSLGFAVKRREKVEVEGTLKVQYEDGPDWQSTFYYLDTGNKEFLLDFDDHGIQLRGDGSRVRVRGVLHDDILSVENASSDLMSVQSSTINWTGEQHTLVMLFNFQDNSGNKPWTPDFVRNLLFTTVDQFYRQASYNSVWFSGDLAGWYTIPVNSTACSADWRTAAENGARALGFEPNNYAHLVFVFPYSSCFNWSGLTINYFSGSTATSEVWINGYANLKNVGHEVGHSLGFAHSNTLVCSGGVLSGTCNTTEYGDPYEIMGNTNAGDPGAVWKAGAGWFGAGQFMEVTSSGIFTLSPLESSDSNLKSIRVLQSVDATSGQSSYYYLEFRQPLGNDAFLSSYPAITGGVLIHQGKSPTSIYATWQSNLLDMTPGTTGGNQALAAGQNYYDSALSLRISVDSVSSSGATVSVTFGAAPPPPPPPPPPDTTPPTIGISSPGNSATVTGTVSIMVNTADNVGVTKVDLYVDGAMKATATAPPFTTKWNAKKAAGGNHVLQCDAYDAAGNRGMSTQITVRR